MNIAPALKRKGQLQAIYQSEVKTVVRWCFVMALSAFGANLNAQQSPRTLTPLQLKIEKQKQRLASTEVEERRDALMQLAGLRRAEASRVALVALADPMPIIRATAASALLSLPPDEAATALIPLLADKDEFVRQHVAYALGMTRSRTAVPPLVERLRLDKRDSVRAAAGIALGQIGDQTAVIPLAETLAAAGTAGKKQKKEKKEFVLRAAAHALGEIRGRAALPVLIETLTNVSLPADVRRAAARSLGLIGDPAALPALRAVSMETDVYLSEAATDAVRRISSNSGKGF